MLLVLIVGGGIGWKLSQQRLKRQAVEAIRQAGGLVLYDYQFSTDPEVLKRIRDVQEPSAPGWLRRWLGDDLFRTVASVRLLKKIKPEVLDSVARLDGLKSLILMDTAGLEDAWTVLGGLNRLEEVVLAGPGVNDQAIQTFGTIVSLRAVHLFNVWVTKEGLGPLARHPGLREFTLGDCQGLTDPGVAELIAGGFPRLEIFDWSKGPGPLPETLGALALHHPDLHRLVLSETPVEDADLAQLGDLANLTILNLRGSRVTDAGLVHLAPLRSLETLWLDSPGVTDEGMKSIASLRNLLRLGLSGSQVGDAGLAELAEMTRLQDLFLSQTRVTDAGLIPLRKLKKLQTLLLNGTAVTPGGVATLQAVLPSTRILSPPRPTPPSPPPTLPH